MSNGKLISASIDVTKIPKDRLVTGKKGTYLAIDIWVNEEEDQYGNHASINVQQTKEERAAKERKTYIGNGKKMFGWDAPAAPKGGSSPTVDDTDDIPFAPFNEGF